MNIKELIKSEFNNFGKYEKIIFPLTILGIIIISIAAKDSIIALISAVCGISYTILAGKGKIFCYYIGITGTICYSYLSYINGFYGNLVLYALYYLPMEVYGIFKWKQHLNEDKKEIIKTKLSNREKIVYFFCTILLSSLICIGLKFINDPHPFFDGITTVFSILGLLLTVKRCIEQWYIWFFVNLMSFIMWLFTYLSGANCLATVLMWFVYFVLSVYFLFSWQQELTKKEK